MAFAKPIALDPGVGGICIGPDALRPADIVVSTTRAGASGVIRIGTGAVVSHAALYVGQGDVIEAIGRGVVRRGLDAALADDALAVAYRCPKVDATIANRIIGFAVAQLGKAYSVKGAVLSSDKILCRLVGPIPATFFCSQLVFESYRRAGMPLTGTPSQCVTPGDAVAIAEKSLTYVGHLLGEPSWLPVVSP